MRIAVLTSEGGKPVAKSKEMTRDVMEVVGVSIVQPADCDKPGCGHK